MWLPKVVKQPTRSCGANASFGENSICGRPSLHQATSNLLFCPRHHARTTALQAQRKQMTKHTFASIAVYCMLLVVCVGGLSVVSTSKDGGEKCSRPIALFMVCSAVGVMLLVIVNATCEYLQTAVVDAHIEANQLMKAGRSPDSSQQRARSMDRLLLCFTRMRLVGAGVLFAWLSVGMVVTLRSQDMCQTASPILFDGSLIFVIALMHVACLWWTMLWCYARCGSEGDASGLYTV